MSQITFLKAGFHDDLAHISSFRRQVYIHPDDNANVPGLIVIKYDNTDFRIFLTDDTLSCYVCHQTGHTSYSCKKNKNNNHDNTSSIQTPTREEDSEKVNDTLDNNNSNSNSAQVTNPINEEVNDSQNSSTNLINN